MAKAEDGNGDKGPQDSTTRLPLIDLETSIGVVSDIREKAVETATMTAVAKALGYAAPTSTPFYRRITAARLFNLLSSKSALTQEAIDYIRPHDEGTKARVLSSAIMGIPYYVELVNRYAGKKLNIELVSNAIAKDCNLTDACAAACAKVFESSLRFAGMLLPDGTVQPAANSPKPPPIPDQEQKTKDEKRNPPQVSAGDTQDHMIFLDKDRSRSFSFTGPLEITRAEYERICKWLEFTMLISDEKKEPQS
jgi:hypothetical protein